MKKLILLSSLYVGLGLSTLSAQENAAPKSVQPVQKNTYAVKNFDHLLGKIEGLDDSLLTMHFKLYQGYVNNTNSLLQKIDALNANGQSRTPEFAGLKRMVGWEFNGMLLHEYYFENLGKTQPLAAQDPLQKKIEQDFGSYEQWKADFISTGMIRGIGWVVCYVEPKNGRLVNEWINEHDLGHLSGAMPLLIMDVFEHAYITQFNLDRNKYIEVFFNNINWDVVSKRFQK